MIATPATVLGGGTYNTQASHAVASWLNEGGAEDIIHKPYPYFYLRWKMAKRAALPRVRTVRLLDREAPEPTPFSGYDTVGTAGYQPGVGAAFDRQFYSMPITKALTDELDFTGNPGAIGDWAGELSAMAVLALVKTLARDIVKGNNTETKRIVGLEQLFWPSTQMDAAGSGTATALERIPLAWLARQTEAGAAAYGGITRTPFTADDVGGTGWEPVVANYFDTAANKFRYSSTAPHAPDLGLQVLDDLILATSYGTFGNKIIVSDQKPFQDYRDAVSTKSTFYMEKSMQMAGVDLMVGHVMVQGRPYFWDNTMRTQNDFSTEAAASSAGDSNVYLIDLDSNLMEVDERLNMRLTNVRTPNNQHASTQFILVSLRTLDKNPRQSGRIFAYPRT